MSDIRDSEFQFCDTDIKATRVSLLRSPNPTAQAGQVVPASTDSVQLDIGIFGEQRMGFTVFNDTLTGTLFVNLGAPASTEDFRMKVPPQHAASIGSWYTYGGEIYGAWDVADGNAMVEEIA